MFGAPRISEKVLEATREIRDTTRLRRTADDYISFARSSLV